MTGSHATFTSVARKEYAAGRKFALGLARANRQVFPGVAPSKVLHCHLPKGTILATPEIAGRWAK